MVGTSRVLLFVVCALSGQSTKSIRVKMPTAEEYEAALAHAQAMARAAEERAMSMEQAAGEKLQQMKEELERHLRDAKESMVTQHQMVDTRQIGKPKEFHGEKKEFKDWAFKTKGYFLSLIHI